jgi:hypothetical protein
MTRLRTAAAVACLALLVAGCAQPANEDALRTSATHAPAPQANETSASLSGVIVDVEQVPIGQAQVADLESKQTAESDERGQFTLNGLEPGPHTLLFQRIGFQPKQQRVELVAGEVATVRVVLSPLAISAEPYHLSIPKTGHINAGNAALTTIWYQGVNQSAYNGLVCDLCKFTLFIDANPTAALAEAVWTGGASGPNINQEIFINYLTKGSEAQYAEPYWLYYGYHTNRAGHAWSESNLKRAQNMTEIRLWLRPDLDGISIDHRVTTWTTLAYHAELPEGFTALPPP